MLATIFGFLLFACLQTYGEFNEIYLLSSVSFVFSDVVGYAVGPLLYAYVVSIYGDDTFLKNNGILIFLPLIMCLIVLTMPRWVVFFGPESIQSDLGYTVVGFINDHDLILYTQPMFLIVCCFFCLERIKYYQKEVKNHQSDLTDLDVRWVRTLCWLLIGLFLFLLAAVYIDIGSIHVGLEYDLFITLGLIGVIIYLGYFGTAQSQVLLPSLTAGEPQANDLRSTPIKTHHLSGASHVEIVQLKEKLLSAMQDDELFLKSDLSLVELAEHIGTTDKKLSALLNHHVEESFYDFVNGYRVDLVKSRLLNPQYTTYSILGIALDSGFSSKASFNRVFKQVTGMSPSQYKSSSGY